jgi:hypothetical protein
VAALRPRYVRVLVDWAKLQPVAGVAPDFAGPSDGCMRAVAPCDPFAGLAATLEAVAAMGAQPVLVLYGTPAWAAAAPAGCERPGTTAYARMPDLGAYAAFVDALLALGRSLRVALPWWSAWNEPNSPAFLNPQRLDCDARSPATAPALYAGLVRTLQARLDAAPGQQSLLLGEVAGISRAHVHAAAAAEFAASLPEDLVCGAGAWAEHAYLVRPGDGGRTLAVVPSATTAATVSATRRALDAHRCPTPPPVWITETGVGDEPDGCARMGEQLRAWAADPRIGAVFQYAFRDDPRYPTGLAGARLDRLYPAYGAWLARGPAGCA